jgi:antitoxin Phd
MSDLLAHALENTRPALEAGIADAERELEECRARCEELEQMIARARALLSESGVEERIPSRAGRLYLHEAMLKVLRAAPRHTMRAPFLAAEINRRRLYLPREGGRVTSHQVHARVYRYPQLFERDAGGVKARV